MTKEEAIDNLQDLWNEVYNEDSDGYTYAVAIDMAIDALKELLSAEPKGDLISRQWLLDLYGDYIGDNGDPKYHVPLEVVRQNIIDAPSADRPTKCIAEIKIDNDDLIKRIKEEYELADRPQGEWVEMETLTDEDSGITEWQSARCSVCGKYHTTPYMYYFDRFNYCPNCGADMRNNK